MSESFPSITIGITAFNAAETLPRAIECALSQIWSNKQIIIVDDCSTDDTPAIIKGYTSAHPSIRYFGQEHNKGVAAARNVILKNATGDFIAFFDDDDFSREDRLEKQYARIVDYKLTDFVLCHSSRLQIYPDGTKRIEKTPGSNLQSVAPQGHSMFEKILLGKPIQEGFGSLATCSLMLPRKVIERVGFYDENFRRCEDTDFTLRFALAGGHFLGIEETLVTQTMTSSSEKSLADEHKYHGLIYTKFESELGKHKTGFALGWLNLRYEFLYHNKIEFIKKFFLLLTKYPLLTLKKLIWALPNIKFNFNFRKFHQGDTHDR